MSVPDPLFYARGGAIPDMPDYMVHLLEGRLDGDDPGAVDGSAICTIVKPPVIQSK